MSYTNTNAIGAFDFVGINYYSHGCMKNFKVTTHKNEQPTNNDRYTLYAEGLYRAIKEMSEKLTKQFNKPLYITENGISTDEVASTPAGTKFYTAHGQEKAGRQEFLQKYLFAVKQAQIDGYDVRGYMYWSFMDNYEWGCFKKKYGLFEVDFNDPALPRRLKPSAQFYLDTIQHTKNAQQR
jgi:beta-glucosidase